MAEIETLTDEEREDLGYLARAEISYCGVDPEPQPACAKALRIIDAQAKRIAELERFATRVILDDAPICPRQHLSPAAEQRVREEQGPCLCASCVACRARPMVPNQDVLHLHADGSVTVRSGPEAVAEWERARVRQSWEEP